MVCRELRVVCYDSRYQAAKSRPKLFLIHRAGIVPADWPNCQGKTGEATRLTPTALSSDSTSLAGEPFAILASDRGIPCKPYRQPRRRLGSIVAPFAAKSAVWISIGHSGVARAAGAG
jgi:hypothetical protein